MTSRRLRLFWLRRSGLLRRGLRRGRRRARRRRIALGRRRLRRRRWRGRSLYGRLTRRGLGDLLQHRAALHGRFVRAQHERQGTNHEHDGAPRGGLRENCSGSARTESGLAACASERASEVSGLAALQENDDYQNEAVHHEENREQRACPAKPDDDDRQTNQNGNSPLHATWHFYLPAQSLTMLANDLASRLAPPTSAPSISSCAINPCILSGLTLPPYRIRNAEA